MNLTKIVILIILFWVLLQYNLDCWIDRILKKEKNYDLRHVVKHAQDESTRKEAWELFKQNKPSNYDLRDIAKNAEDESIRKEAEKLLIN